MSGACLDTECFVVKSCSCSIMHPFSVSFHMTTILTMPNLSVTYADIGSDSLSDPAQSLETHTWTHADGDLTGQWASKASPLTAQDQFDLVSCQFAMHYMFQTKDKADHFFSEISRHLKKGGHFIATTTDVRVIADLVAEKECAKIPTKYEIEKAKGKGANFSTNTTDNSANMDVDATGSGSSGDVHKDKKCLEIKNELDSTLLRITFDEKNWRRLLRSPTEYAAEMAAEKTGTGREDAYGVQCDFALFDNPGECAVDAPEWLVPIGPELDALCARHGMRVKRVQNFHEFVSAGLQVCLKCNLKSLLFLYVAWV